MTLQTFSVLITGQIESVDYTYRYGPDWMPVAGLEQGLTQVASHGFSLTGPAAPLVWNFPIEIAFRSTNVFGWPQLVIAVYGPNSLGQGDVVKGYVALRLPLAPGPHTLYGDLYVPQASSRIAAGYTWLRGHRPEFREPHFVAGGEGRGVTAVRSSGCVKVTLHVVTRDMEQLGYAVRPAPPSIVAA
ncbi:B9-domain-containing protein [Caulochytrium protostelioides]|uniref:B9 domain-containing protein 1 n=1 Tax=Caulochytrium protostelioides TaxID=1555241 RepID=A0A4P9X0W7_9FUNG|nr:B9-domain-containing protein [Caulochytrium protostelioides]